MLFEPIGQARLYRRIADTIAAMIGRGDIAVGQRLPSERDLAERLGVSRPSLREALIALEIDGCVEIRSGSGVYVVARPRRRDNAPANAPANAPGPFEILEARLVVEPECAALAARNANMLQRGRINAAFERLRSGADLDADRDFHVAIAEASGNATFARFVAELWAAQTVPVTTRLERFAVSPSRRSANLAEHRDIREAIGANDARAARVAMRRHLTAVRRNRLAALRQAD